jgi:O-antigen/teichoic acid export membrane protein
VARTRPVSVPGTKPVAIRVRSKPSLAKDVTSQVWIQFLLKVTLGVSSIMLARHLSATDNGLLGTAWAYVAFAQFLTDMGFNTVLVREASAADDARRRILVWTSLRSRGLLAFGIAILVLIASFFVREIMHSNEIKQADLDTMAFLLRALVFPMMIANMLFTWAEGVMVATERVSLAARFSLIWACGNILATTIVLLTNSGLPTYTLLQLICAWTLALGGVLWVKREYAYTNAHDPGMQKSVAAFGIAGVLTNLVQSMPSFILPGMMNFATIGAFQQGYKIPQVLLAIPGGVAKAYFTRMCKAWETDRAEHTKLILSALRFGSLIGGVIGVGLCTIAPELIHLLFGNKWPVSTNTTLAVTAFVPWVIMITSPLEQALSSSNRYALRTKLLTIQVVAALVAYMTLPRWFGIVGVAVSVLALEVIMLVVYWIVADPAYKWKVLRTILEQTVLVLAAALLALFFKSVLQSVQVLPLLAALIAGTSGALVFVVANLVVDQELRGMALDRIGGRSLKRL